MSEQQVPKDYIRPAPLPQNSITLPDLNITSRISRLIAQRLGHQAPVHSNDHYHNSLP